MEVALGMISWEDVVVEFRAMDSRRDCAGGGERNGNTVRSAYESVDEPPHTTRLTFIDLLSVSAVADMHGLGLGAIGENCLSFEARLKLALPLILFLFLFFFDVVEEHGADMQNKVTEDRNKRGEK